jgi:FixJ family two-component response regulator
VARRGCRYYLEKPFDDEKLLQVVFKIFRLPISFDEKQMDPTQ